MMPIQVFLEKSGCEADLAKLIGEVIPSAVREIAEAIKSQKGELAGSQNIYGEKQLKLDVQSNQIVMDAFKKSGLVNLMASEELDEEVEAKKSAPFTVVFDPLDGSSLVDVNLAVGSIFGIYKAGSPIGKTGDDQLAACFAVYGPRTTLVITIKKGTHEFRLESDGKFHLTHENLHVGEDSKHFAPGNLRAAAEREDYLKLTNEWIKTGLTLRYSGGMVPDLNHILLKGDGIFAYPSYSKTPEGKLRLLFECAPMALLVENAGGAALDGEGVRILEKQITELHKRTPIFIGSKNTVQEAIDTLRK